MQWSKNSHTPGFPGLKMHASVVRACLAVLFAALALWISSPIIATGSWFRSHDGRYYLYRLIDFHNAFDAGIWYPRWLPESYGGYGYPVFVFYQPGFFYLTLPFTWFTDAVTASICSIFCALLAGAVGAYLLARLWHPRWLSFCLAIVFLFSNYIAVNLFVRGDLSELFAMLLCPWNALFLLRLTAGVRSGQNPCWDALGFTVSTLLIIVTHPFVTFLWLPFAAGLIVVEAASRAFDWRVLITGFICQALAVTLAAPYWVPTLQFKGHVDYPSALIGIYDVMSTLRNARALFGTEDWKQTPLWWFLAALLGFALEWRRPMVRYAACVFLFYFFMMTYRSQPLWELGHPVLKYLQFSWRILSVLTTIGYLGIVQLGFPLLRLHARNRRFAAISMCIASAAVCGVLLSAHKQFHLFWMVNPADRLVVHDFDRIMREENLSRLMGSSEFRPILARPEALRNRYANPVAVAELIAPYPHGSAVAEMPDSTPHRIRLRLALGGPGLLVINQLYFPGFKLLVGGKTVPWQGLSSPSAPRDRPMGVTASPSPEGRIQLSFATGGAYVVEAWYDGPPGWPLRNALVAAFSAVLLVALRCCWYGGRGRGSTESPGTRGLARILSSAHGSSGNEGQSPGSGPSATTDSRIQPSCPTQETDRSAVLPVSLLAGLAVGAPVAHERKLSGDGSE
jgi:hypothetical protein